MALSLRVPKLNTQQATVSRGWQGRSQSFGNKLASAVQTQSNLPSYVSSFLYSKPSTVQTEAGSTDTGTGVDTTEVAQQQQQYSYATLTPQQQQQYSYATLTPDQKSKYAEEIATAIGAPAAKIASEEDFYYGNGVGADYRYNAPLGTEGSVMPYAQWKEATGRPWEAGNPYGARDYFEPEMGWQQQHLPSAYEGFQKSYKDYSDAMTKEAGTTWQRLANSFTTENSLTPQGWGNLVYNRYNLPDDVWSKFVVPYLQENAPTGSWPHTQKQWVSDVGMDSGRDYDRRFYALAAQRRANSGTFMEDLMEHLLPYIPGVGTFSNIVKGINNPDWTPTERLINTLANVVSPGFESAIQGVSKTLGKYIVPDWLKPYAPAAGAIIGGIVAPWAVPIGYKIGTHMGGQYEQSPLRAVVGAGTAYAGAEIAQYLKALSAAASAPNPTLTPTINPGTSAAAGTAASAAPSSGIVDSLGNMASKAGKSMAEAAGNIPRMGMPGTSSMIASLIPSSTRILSNAPSAVKTGLKALMGAKSAYDAVSTAKGIMEDFDGSSSQGGLAGVNAARASLASAASGETSSTNYADPVTVATGTSAASSNNAGVSSGSSALQKATYSMASIANKLANIRRTAIGQRMV